MNVLVIAAHPDDEVLGCGGTIVRLAQAGHQVYIAILGEGITSRYTQRDHADPALLATLHNRSQQVADLLGAKELFMYNLPDNRFDTVPLLEIVKIIEELVESVTPQVIYTQHGGDLNIDHNLLYRATLTATRPMVGTSVKTVYAYEVASSTEWAFQRFSPVFHPNIFVDISQTLNLKLEAMRMYESEIRQFPHPRSAQALQAIAQRWGSVVGLEAAEAFELVREIH
ncbi:MAG: LmbE family protein [Chloroflexota bacterium]|nr:MAG: LmbE family protein [Chloroflexota bacterium]